MSIQSTSIPRSLDLPRDANLGSISHGPSSVDSAGWKEDSVALAIARVPGLHDTARLGDTVGKCQVCLIEGEARSLERGTSNGTPTMQVFTWW